MLPNKFQVKWPFGSGEEEKNTFQNLGLPIRAILANPDASYQVSSQLTFWFKRRSVKLISKTVAMAAILDHQWERF